MLKLIKNATATTVLGLLLALSLAPILVSAHEQESEGSITAVMHITPHDKPVANKTAKIEIALKDSAAKFKLIDCDCSVTINRDGKQITILPLQAVSARVSSNPYTFTEPGAYQLIVRGQSLADESHETFEPFSFTYPVTVDVHDDSIPTVVWIGVGTMIALVLAVAISMSTVPKRFKL